MRDPLRSPGAANVGAAGLSRVAGAQWELGVVVEYNSATHTSLVRTHSGRPLPDVPQIKATGGGYDHLETGTNVVICWNLGFPAIIGCIDFVGAAQAAITPPSITGVEGYGDSDPTQATEGLNSYKPPTAPTDMQPGDWAQVGADGNHVAVMAGGMTVLGSPTAQVRSFGRSGVLQHVARRMQAVTDFGQWRVENDQGRTSFVLRAGAGQATQTGLDEQHWTIRLDLGATGDVLDFKISEPGGKLLFRLHAGGDGRVQIYGDGGVDVSSGAQGAAETRHDVAGRRVSAVASSDSLSVAGNRSAVVDGSCSTEIAGDATRVIGGSEVLSVGGDAARGVGGDLASVVGGDVALKVGGKTDAKLEDDLATLIDGALSISARKSIAVKASGAASLTGSHVTLGSGGHPLPKFDAFLRDLSDFLSHLVSAIGCLVPSNPFGLAIQLALMQKFIIFTSQGFPYESRKCSNE